MTTKKQNNEREIALGIVIEAAEHGGYIHNILKNELDKYSYLDKRERSFTARLAEGTIEYRLQLDAVIDRYSRTKTAAMKPFIRNLLRISVYQILYMDSVPDSAVCNEAVKLAQKHQFHGLKGFVNGVLRTVSRRKEELVFDTLSDRYSMPQWLVELWETRYGLQVTEQMLRAFLEPKKLYIRCNRTKCTFKQLKESLEREHVKLEQAPYMEEALSITGFDMLYSLEAFRSGYFQVQDVSSMLAVAAAMPKEQDRILDVCAAPGGKAVYAADLLNGTGLVEARDLTEYKIERIEENIDRLGLANIRTKQHDARILDEEWVEKADIVLADLPCSGLGVIGRKPDIKYRVRYEQLEQLQTLQRDILNTVCRYVKPGGILIYSTCTINPLENEDNVAWLTKQFDFELESLEGCPGFTMDIETKAQGYVQLLPGVHKTDGFFIAKLRRKM